MYSENTEHFYPIFEFKSTSQELIKAKSTMGLSANSYKINEQVIIIYDPENPANAEIFNHFRLKTLPRIFLIIGFVSITIGLLQIFHVINLKLF